MDETNLYRTRGHMRVNLNRRRGGVEGIYHCVIPDSTNVTQTIYIGVYTARNGESMLCSFQPYCSSYILSCTVHVYERVASSYLKAVTADPVSSC